MRDKSVIPASLLARANYLTDWTGRTLTRVRPVDSIVASISCTDTEVKAKLARDLGTAMPHGLATLEKLKEAEAKGDAERYMALILRFLREDTS